MYLFYLPALLSLAIAQRPALETSQIAYPHQQQAGNNPWDRIDVHELDKQLAAWHNEPISSTARPVQNAIQARQGYPDIPRPIPPIGITPTIPPEPIPLPQGCLAPRGQFPSSRSCAHYLNCWDDVVIEQQCPGGLLFNEITSVCDFEYNVYCNGRPAPTPKPELPPGSKVCPDPNGRYRSSTNCSEFFVCVYGKPVKYNCPRGLVYNEELGVCDYTYRVDCRGAASPAPWTPPQTQPPRPPTLPPRPTPTPKPQYPIEQPHDPYYPPQQPQPQPPYYPPQQPQTQPPYYPPQQTYPQPAYPQPTYPPSPYPWTGNQARIEPDPWHQRPVASEWELQQERDKLAKEEQQQQGANVGPLNLQQDTPKKPVLVNPWGQVHAVPASLTKVPCKDGDIHRLTDSCSSVVVCRKGRPQLVQCPLSETYDRPSDSCKVFTLAKC